MTAPTGGVRPPTIAILGHVGASNLGDEAIIESVRRNLARLLPGATLIGVTTNAGDTAARHGLRTLPLRREVPVHRWREDDAAPPPPPPSGPLRAAYRRLAAHPTFGPLVRPLREGLGEARKVPSRMPGELRLLWNSYRELRDVDLLIVAGSNQLQDEWGGAWAFPYTLFKWCALARLAGARVCFLSIGGNPLTSSLSRIFLSLAARSADYRSYRDPGSKDLAAHLTRVDGDPVVPDLVFSLPIDGEPARPPGEGPLVRINLMTLDDGSKWPLTSQEVFQSYLGAVADFTVWLRGRGFRVELFHTQAITDRAAIAGFEAHLRARGEAAPLTLHAPATPQEALALIRGADYIVATRFHAILLSLLAAQPVIGLAYGRKAHELMGGLGQSAGAVAVERCSFAILRDRFRELERDRDARVEVLRRRTPELRAILEEQYHRILALIPDGGGRAPSAAPAFRRLDTEGA